MMRLGNTDKKIQSRGHMMRFGNELIKSTVQMRNKLFDLATLIRTSGQRDEAWKH
jgi:hypothetical protein